MVKVDSAKSAGDYFAALIPPTSTTLYTARFYAKDSLGGLAFGLSKSTAAAGGIFYTGGNYTLGTTYVVVIKYMKEELSERNRIIEYFQENKDQSLRLQYCLSRIGSKNKISVYERL